MKKRAKVTWYYMHTLDGRPAAFDGRQVHFMANGDRLVGSLKELREQQKASATYRAAHGYEALYPYGYRRVRLPSHGGGGGQ